MSTTAPVAYAAPSIRPSGASFSQLQSNGLSGLIQLLIAANSALANPTTAPTVNVTGGGSTGGLLPAGTYFVSYAWDNGVGRTTSKESAASFTVGAGNVPQVTLPSFPTGVASAHIYLTAAGGASGSEAWYGVATSTTFNLALALYADPATPQPIANTTSLAGVAPSINMGQGFLQLLWTRYSDALSAFVRGDPTAGVAAAGNLRKISASFHAIAQAMDDAAALAYANPGTLTVTTSPFKSGPATKRTWP